MKAEATGVVPPAWAAEPGKLLVRGSLKRQAIAQLDSIALPELVGPEVEVNLGQVIDIDTAGLALLLSWQGDGQARGLQLRYTHAPRAAAAMMQAYDLAGLLDVSDRRL